MRYDPEHLPTEQYGAAGRKVARLRVAMAPFLASA